MRLRRGFTLIEILVVLAITGILAAVLYANFGDAAAKSRDAERKQSLLEVQAALELYKNKYGQYPAGCNDISNGITNFEWSGQLGSNYACTVTSAGTNNYIVGLVPEFLNSLPLDTRTDDTTEGYRYVVNDEKSVYKFVAYKTVETEVVSRFDYFSHCSMRDTNMQTRFANNEDLCNRDLTNNATRRAACDDSSIEMRTSYGVFDGFASGVSSVTGSQGSGRWQNTTVYRTQLVACKP